MPSFTAESWWTDQTQQGDGGGSGAEAQGGNLAEVLDPKSGGPEALSDVQGDLVACGKLCEVGMRVMQHPAARRADQWVYRQAERGAQAIGTGLQRAGAAMVRLGQAGEAAVRAAFDIGPKLAIDVAGRTRIPDGLTTTVLSEVKNVRLLNYTLQLRDFAQFAGEHGLLFDLYVRSTTQLSLPLSQAVQSGAINLRLIP